MCTMRSKMKVVMLKQGSVYSESVRGNKKQTVLPAAMFAGILKPKRGTRFWFEAESKNGSVVRMRVEPVEPEPEKSVFPSFARILRLVARQKRR